MNFDRMRELLLDKAIRGLLVAQDPNDTPVTQLGPAPESEPFAIPSSWKWVSLGNVVDYAKCTKVCGNDITENTWVLDLEDIEKNRGNVLVKKRGIKTKSEKNVFDQGYVLYSKLRPYLNKVVIADEAGICTTEIVPIDVSTAKLPLSAGYLQKYLMSPAFLEYANKLSYGVKMPRLGTKDAIAALIPIPPIAEQQRIVDKLNELFAEIERAQKAYEELQSLASVLRGQILQQAIEGKLVPQLPEDGIVEQLGTAPETVPFAIPSSWKWVTLNEVGFWKAGGTPSRSVKEYYDNGTIPWLKTGDLTDGKVKFVDEYITEKGLDSCSAHINPKGSVLIAMYGATIGKLGLLEIDCATNQACCACRVNEELVLNWYLFYYLMSQRSNFILKGAGGAQPNISRTKIISHAFPLPPLAEQKRIVEKVEYLLKQVDAIAAQ